MKYQFRTRPYPSQVRGLKHLVKNRGGGLFWEPGTGKTKTALDYIAALFKAGKVKRVLVLVPINAMQVWERQARIHMPIDVPWVMEEPEGTIAEKTDQVLSIIKTDESVPGNLVFLLLNYDAIIKRDRKWKIMKALEQYDADILVCDESQKVKNPTAKRSKAAHRLGARSDYVVLMTGTPVSKNYLDLYSQLKVIDPKIWWDKDQNRPMIWTRFKQRYGIWGGRTGYELRGYQNLDELQASYKPHITTARRRRNLPRATDSIIPLAMNPNAREAYDFFAEEGLVVWRSRLIEAPIPLTKLLRLQQMAGGAVHDEVGELIEFHHDKVAGLLGIVEELRDAGRKFLVFARFKWEMDTIASHIKVPAIRGGVSSQRRKVLVDEFVETDKFDALIIQASAGEALDGLQHACSDAIFYSTDFSWDHYSQARGRIDRDGQSTPVVFWHLHMVGTVDKLVYRALRDKRNLEKMVMDDPDVLLDPGLSEY